MNRQQRIQSILKKNFEHFKIDVIDVSNEHIGHNNFNGYQESHFKIILKKKIDIKESRLATHRQINKLLEKEFTLGLHALQIKII
jgi:BolA protein